MSDQIPHIQGPSVIYHGLGNTIHEVGDPNDVHAMSEKDLWVLSSLLNQAQSIVHREMNSRNPHQYPTPPW